MRSKRQHAKLFGRAKPATDLVEVPSDRTENEEARRKARDWLRSRDEHDTPEFEDEPQCSWM